MVARQNKAIPPDAKRLTAQRMNAHPREVDSSHVAMTSQPDTVTDMIIDAARLLPGGVIAAFSGRPASTHAVLAQVLDYLDEVPSSGVDHPPPRR